MSVLAVIIVLLGLCGILGNLLGIPWLTSLGINPDIPMRLPTGIGLACFGLVLLCARKEPAKSRFCFYREAVLLAIAGGLGLYYLVISLFVANFDLLALITSDFGILVPFLSIFNLLLCCIALSLFVTKKHSEAAMVYGVCIPAIIVINFSVFALVGYWLNIPALYDFRMSFPTSAAYLLLGISLLLGTIPYHGLLDPLVSREPKIRLLAFGAFVLGTVILIDGIMDMVRLQETMATAGLPLQGVEKIIFGYEVGTLMLAMLVKTLALRAIHFWDVSSQTTKAQIAGLDRESTIRRMIGIVHSSLELEDVFQKIVDEVGNLLKADRAYIARFDQSSNHLAPPTREFRSSDAIPSMIGADHRISPEDGWLIEAMCKEEIPFPFDRDTPRLSPATHAYFREIQLESGVGCTIKYHDKCLAILFIHQIRQREWTQDELYVMQTAASQVAVAIHQSNLFGELKETQADLKRRYGQQEVVNKLSQAALMGVDQIKIFEEAVDVITSTLDVKYCKILQRVPGTRDHIAFKAVAGWNKDLVGRKFQPQDETHAAYTLQVGEPVIVEDMERETRFPLAPLHREYGIVSGISVTIDGEKDIYGVLEADTDERRIFTPDEVRFLKTVANVLGIVIERMMIEKSLSDIKFALDQSDIVAITDKQGTITYVNDAFCRISKYAPDELIGQNHRIINSGHHPKDFFTAMWATIGSGHVWHGEIMNRAKDTTYYWVDTTIVPFLDEEGEPYQYVAVRHDISRRKAFEQALAESNRDLEHFATVASHDLQAPLRKIRTFSERVLLDEKDNLNPESWDLLVRINRSVETAHNLVNDLLALSKATNSGQPFRELELSTVVARAINNLEDQILDKQANVEVGALGSLIGDASQLEQLFQNLIENGLKYQPENQAPLIKVYSECLDHQFCDMTIEDNGIGFDPEKAERIFQPFERLHGKSSPYTGTGVGLAICKRIVDRHGGTITATSAPGQGAKFTVRLPYKPTEVIENPANMPIVLITSIP